MKGTRAQTSGNRVNDILGLRKLTAVLRDLIGDLPTAAERNEIAHALAELSQMFDELRSLVEMLPAADEVSEANAALDKLDAFATRAEASARLASLLNAGKPHSSTPHSGKRVPASEIRYFNTEEELALLRTLSSDAVQAKLAGDNYSLAELKALAVALNMRLGSKTTKSVLATQIGSTISNLQGYEILRGEARPKP